MIGSRVSHFRILGRLGRLYGDGGAGIYRAEDLAGGGVVLLHFLAPERAGGEALERFRRAALGAAALSHPNIAAVREVGETGDGRLYLALPAADGETLEDLLARGALPPRDAVDLAAQIAAGLARAHAAGFVHGDLGPSSILVTSYDEVKIAGFGLGELAGPGAPEEGAASCRAPEVVRGERPGPPADVWSLGALLQQMTAGEPLPPGLERIAARTLAPRPADRYPDAGPLEADLLRAYARFERTPDLTATRREIPLEGGPVRSVTDDGTPPPGDMAGRKLPSYRIFEILGSGGMAVVYRAEDTRLERMVALKFLAPEISRDPLAKARFLREARAASSLDHPNLCTIHETGETEDGRIFLAMPYYGGETLAQRIARGPVLLDEALDIALQVAQGLAKAHRHGIVHRDIKPANLMLTADGVVKIVDFGLAKLADASGSRSSPRAGSAAGTVAYVSPEQARGDDVDPRTDLWSLGVVLYEMVTGRRPFRGDGDQAVLYAVLRQEPEPLAALLPEAPPLLARIAGRLLAKNREQRYAGAESVAADLRALRGPESLGSRPVIALPGRPAGVRPGWRLGTAALVLLALLVGALTALFWERGGRGGAPPVAASYVALTDQPGKETFPSLAPDGDFFVYAAETGGRSHIVWQRVGGGNPTDLTPDDGFATQPAISPDGQQVVFRSEREGGGLFAMGATGESLHRVADLGYNPAWSPDGREIVCATAGVAGPWTRGRPSQLWRVVLATGERRLLRTGDAVQPSWSPHNRRIAYWGIPPGTSRRVIWTVPADGGGEPVPVVDDLFYNWSPVWSPDGGFLYFASNRSGSMNLWRVPIDERSGRPQGEPQQITAPAPSGVLPSLARDGRHIAFATEVRKANLFRVELDPVRRQTAGPLQPVTQGSRVVRSGEMSPDGQQVVFDTAEPQEDLFVARADGGDVRPLTADAAKDRGPHWSRDGSRILFFSDRGGRYEAWSLDVLTGARERLTALAEGVLDPLGSPDGRSLLYTRAASGPVLIDLTLPLSERRPRPLPVEGQPPADFVVTSWSADGDWLAGYDEMLHIVLYSFAARRYETLPELGEEVMWLRDGRTLLFLRDGALWALERSGGGVAGAARKLLDPPPGLAFSRLSVGPGDRSLALVAGMNEGNIGMLTLE